MTDRNLDQREPSADPVFKQPVVKQVLAQAPQNNPEVLNKFIDSAEPQLLNGAASNSSLNLKSPAAEIAIGAQIAAPAERDSRSKKTQTNTPLAVPLVWQGLLFLTAVALVNLVILDVFLAFGASSIAVSVALVAERVFAAITAIIGVLTLNLFAPEVGKALLRRKLTFDLLTLLALALVVALSIANIFIPEFGLGLREPLLVVVGAIVVRHVVALTSNYRVDQFVSKWLPGEDNSNSSAQKGPELRLGEVVQICVGERATCDLELLNGICEVLERPAGGVYIRTIKSPGDLILYDSKILRVNLRGSDEKSPQDGAESLTCKVRAQRTDSRVHLFDTELEKRVGSYRAEQEDKLVAESLIVLLAIAIAFASCFFWAATASAPVTLAKIVLSILLVAIVGDYLRLRSRLLPVFMVSAYAKGFLLNGASLASRLSKIKSVVFNYSKDYPLAPARIAKFELLDERIDERAVYGVLYAIGSAINSGEQKNFESHQNASSSSFIQDEFAALSNLFRVKKELPLVAVEAFQVFYDNTETNAARSHPRGVLAAIEGSRVVVGTEEFLIENGVQLQPSDIADDEALKSGETVWYIGFGREVAARFMIEEGTITELKACCGALKDSGLKVALVSELAQDKLDLVGKSLGLELANIKGSLSKQELAERLASGKDSLLYTPEAVAGSSANQASTGQVSTEWIEVVPFNRLLWNFQAGDIVPFQSDPRGLPELFNLAKSGQQFAFVGLALAVFLSVLMVLLAAAGLVSPWVIAVAGLFGLLGLTILFNYYLRPL